MASTECSAKEKTEVGARAAASRRVEYPNAEAYLMRDSGFLEFETLDCPVKAKSEGWACLDFGLLSARMC